MYTSKFKKLHHKCLDILEMITECNNRISRKQSELNIYLACPANRRWIDFITFDEARVKKDIHKMKCTKERLVQYYTNTFSQLVQPAVKRIIEQQLEEVA